MRALSWAVAVSVMAAPATAFAASLAAPIQRDAGSASGKPTLRTIDPSYRLGPFLRLQVPQRVEVNQPIELRLTLVHATDLAGYEGMLLFDVAAAEFSVLEQRNTDLRRSFGREVAQLGPTEVSQGVTFGAYSCPVSDCISRAGPRRTGARGNVELATLSILPRKSGMLQFRLANLRFVTASGASFSPQIPSAVISVAVGSAGRTFAPPAAPWTLTPKAAVPGPADVTGDGSVTNADAASVALAWQLAREGASPCGSLEDTRADVNGDGCVDVADVQRVSANFSPVAPAGGPPSSSAPTAANPTVIVNSTADPGTGICDASECTLREAITQANTSAGSDSIAFNITTGSDAVKRIQLGSKLPTITDESGGLSIDGYTQPGSAITPANPAGIKIEVRGASPTTDAITVTSANNVIRGLAVFGARKVISLFGLGADHNLIAGNYIGIDTTGTQRTPAGTTNAIGLNITNGAADNTIGGTQAVDRNVISGNGKMGISTAAEGSDHNLVINNVIGLTPSGNVREPRPACGASTDCPDMGNGQHGIDLNKHSSYNRIEQNVISNNGCAGLEISHGTLTVENQVLGNLIGTDVQGGGSLGSGPNGGGNGCSGVQLEDGVTNNLIADNVIGFNGHRGGGRGGVELSGFYTDGNRVRDNQIGVNLEDPANPNDDVAIPNDVTGGTAGVVLTDHAVRTTVGPGNVIANNAIGVWIKGSADTDYHRITQNSIFDNTGLGIDIYPQGPNPNDVGDPDMGPNDGLNYPVITAASQTVVQGTACQGCRIEVFAADPDPSGQGEGATFLGATTAPNGTFSVGVSVPEGTTVTATAIDAQGNTSEFSLNAVVSGTGGTPGPSPAPSPTPCAAVCASDAFSRTVSDGWGAADIGGVWAPDGNATCAGFTVTGACDLDVNGLAGTMNVATTGSPNARGAYLTGVSVLNGEFSFSVMTNRVVSGTTGAKQYVQFAARRSMGKTEYRGRIEFRPPGVVTLRATRVVDGVETLLGSNKVVTGLTHQANGWINVRARVTGTDPTTIEIRAWAADQPEPGAWQYTVSDGAPPVELQRPGAVGLRSYVAAGTDIPIVFSFDDFLATNLDVTAPPPAASLAVDFTDTSTGSPTGWSWDSGGGQTSISPILFSYDDFNVTDASP